MNLSVVLSRFVQVVSPMHGAEFGCACASFACAHCHRSACWLRSRNPFKNQDMQRPGGSAGFLPAVALRNFQFALPLTYGNGTPSEGGDRWGRVGKEAATNWWSHKDARQGAALAYYSVI